MFFLQNVSYKNCSKKLDRTITFEEFGKVIKDLGLKNAPGPDDFIISFI